MSIELHLLVLQHMACEPPVAFEDKLRARGLDLKRIELDEGERPPDWRDFAAVTPELAVEWGDVPAYAQSLERIQVPGALDRLAGEVGAHASSTIPLARGLFGRWLERVARVPAQAIG